MASPGCLTDGYPNVHPTNLVGQVRSGQVRSGLGFSRPLLVALAYLLTPGIAKKVRHWEVTARVAVIKRELRFEHARYSNVT